MDGTQNRMRDYWYTAGAVFSISNHKSDTGDLEKFRTGSSKKRVQVEVAVRKESAKQSSL